MKRPRYEAYIEHALTLNEEEMRLRDRLVAQLPDVIIDSHTHTALCEGFDHEAIPQHVHAHMMSTFPTFTREDSLASDRVIFPGKTVHKARFAHAFAGIDKRAVNNFVTTMEGDDIPILFGVSETTEEVDYTVSEIESGKYKGLKMYYLSGTTPKYELFDYFPRPALDAAQKQGMPIILHLPHSLYRSENEVHELVEEYPDLKIILAHVGVANLPKPELDGVLSRFAEHEHVYVDTALVDADGIALKALKHLGANKVLYGSDEPLNLLRTVTYFNPELNTARVLTDFPYHWADPTEQSKYRSLAHETFVHNHWLQLATLLHGINSVTASPAERQNVTESVFETNARRIYGLD